MQCRPIDVSEPGAKGAPLIRLLGRLGVLARPHDGETPGRRDGVPESPFWIVPEIRLGLDG